MSLEKSGYLILGILNNGNKFRPSDWIERIASIFGNFDSRQRLRYHPMVAPARLNGQSGLFVDSNLVDSDSAAYHFIMDFAHNNQLQIIAINQPDIPRSPVELQKVA